MDPSVVQAAWTAGSFLVFAGIVAWAWSRRAAREFQDAERLPFADPSDTGPQWPAGEERSR